MATTKKELRNFGILVGTILPIFVGYIIPAIYGHSFKIWTIYTGMPLIIFGVFYPRILKKPFTLWMKIGLILGWINSRIILGIIYFLILVPIAFFMKLIGYDPLQKKDTSYNTYKINKSEISDLTKLF